MTFRCCIALIWTALLGIATLTAISGGEARAGGLGVVVRVQQDFYQPLVPVTKNFRTCFQTDAAGAQTIGICTGPAGDDRTPAGKPDAAAPDPKAAPESPATPSRSSGKPKRP